MVYWMTASLLSGSSWATGAGSVFGSRSERSSTSSTPVLRAAPTSKPAERSGKDEKASSLRAPPSGLETSATHASPEALAQAADPDPNTDTVSDPITASATLTAGTSADSSGHVGAATHSSASKHAAAPKMTVTALRMELASRGLPTGGLKSLLLARVSEARELRCGKSSVRGKRGGSRRTTSSVGCRDEKGRDREQGRG